MPHKSFEVFVEPDVLVWARESIGRNIEEVAKRLNVSNDLVKRWENGEKKPTLNQLKNLTKFYKRPLGAFFLPEPPKELSLPKDFRTLPEETRMPLSPKTRLAIRRARRLQSLAVELKSALQEEIVLKIGSVNLTDDPEVVADQTREFFGVDIQTQFHWGNEYVALREWIKALEKIGLLVLQMSFSIEDARALSLTDGEIPVIILNTGDSIKARIFSLFHEFGHILLNKGGICNPNRGTWDSPDQHNSPEGIRLVEKFCNHFSGALLVPKAVLLNHKIIKSESSSLEWSDNTLGKIARDFKVSREVILRRLVILGRASQAFYQKKRAEWEAEAKVAKEEEKQKVLLSLEREFRQDLINEFVSNELIEAFEDKNLALGSNAVVTQIDDMNWDLEDDKNTYKIEDTGTLLEIYKLRRGGGPPPPRKCILENGAPFVSLVLESYAKDKITYSDVSDYLGIRLKHLPKVEKLVMG
ncbi:MAG TPA: XRE family transcriptional regulator [Desulfobacteria bacterium]|nr:XRE family transcriptional regulator [Desulfobacteria bacterium]